jgi:putative hydrolase of the HAD superfamily
LTAPKLILDVGGVLIDHDNALLERRLVDLFDGAVTPERLMSAFRESGVGAGRMPAERVYLDLAARLGAPADVVRFLALWSSHFTPKPDMLDFLAERGAREPIVLCSNTNAAHWDFIERHFALSRRVAAAVLSHECGYEKPDAEIYALAVAAHDAAPQDCLFIDDRAEFVEAARAAGLRGHVFTNRAGLEAALAD